MTTAIRPDVVSVLVDLDLDLSRGPLNQRHLDGSPLTPEEEHVIIDATLAELRAAVSYHATITEMLQRRSEDISRLNSILQSYATSQQATIGDILPLLTPAERAEVEAILGQHAPDGNIILRQVLSES